MWLLTIDLCTVLMIQYLASSVYIHSLLAKTSDYRHSNGEGNEMNEDTIGVGNKIPLWLFGFLY